MRRGRPAPLDGHTCVAQLERLARDTDASGEWGQERAATYSERVAAIHRGCPVCGRLIPERMLPDQKETTA